MPAQLGIRAVRLRRLRRTGGEALEACMLVSTAALAGCSSSYEQARSPRIVTVMNETATMVGS
jgi:hypothetical protein